MRECDRREGIVYFIRIGKFLKIGFTTNLERRIKQFRTSSPDIKVVASFHAPQIAERELHERLREQRITREFFRYDVVVQQVLEEASRYSLVIAISRLKLRQESNAKKVAWERMNLPYTRWLARNRDRLSLEQCIKESMERHERTAQSGKN